MSEPATTPEVWILTEDDYDSSEIYGVFTSEAAAEAEIARVVALTAAVEAALPPKPAPQHAMANRYDPAWEPWIRAREAAYKTSGISVCLSISLSIHGPFPIRGGA